MSFLDIVITFWSYVVWRLFEVVVSHLRLFYVLTIHPKTLYVNKIPNIDQYRSFKILNLLAFLAERVLCFLVTFFEAGLFKAHLRLVKISFSSVAQESKWLSNVRVFYIQEYAWAFYPDPKIWTRKYKYGFGSGYMIKYLLNLYYLEGQILVRICFLSETR